jgi:3-oxoacyl-[acyl-carrier-protein] synthase-3
MPSSSWVLEATDTGGVRPSAYLVSTGHAHPENRLTNADLEAMVDTSDEWLRSHLGVVERRVVDGDTSASVLGAEALSEALDGAGWVAQELDGLVCAVSCGEAYMPSTAALIGGRTGASRAFALDVNTACSGFVVGLSVAEGLAGGQHWSRFAVCAAETTTTTMVDYDDRETCIFWGDSAGAAVLQREPPEVGAAVVGFELAGDNDSSQVITAYRADHFRHDGRAAYSYAVGSTVDVTRALLGRHGVDPSEVRALVCHQSNLRVIEEIGAKLGIPEERQWHNVEWAGNQASAGVVTALSDGLQKNRAELADGDWLVLATVGSGLNTAVALLRWIDQR